MSDYSDEKPAVVLDSGTSTLKFGLSGEIVVELGA